MSLSYYPKEQPASQQSHFQVGNAVAKQPVDENNKALTSKTALKFIVNNEVRGISVLLLHSRTQYVA